MSFLQELTFLKLFFLVFWGGLLISPFIFWPEAKVPFEVPKAIFVHRWIEISSILGILAYTVKPKGKIGDVKIITLVAAFLVAAIVSSYFGVNFTKSYIGNYYRADGLITLIHLVVLFLTAYALIGKEYLRKTLFVIFISGVLLSAISIIYYISTNVFGQNFYIFPTWQGATGITFGNPNFLAGYLVVTLPICYYFSLNPSQSKFKSILFIIQCAAILLTKAWAGLLGMLIFLFIQFVLVKKSKIAAIAGIIILIGILPTVFGIFSATDSQNNILVAESRQRIFTKGLIAFSQKPIFGWGWGNFDYAFESVDWPIKINNDVYVDKAHSVFLEILVTTGITGALIYLLIITMVLRNLFKLNPPYRHVLITCFLLYLVHSQTNIISISEEILFWLIAGYSTRSNQFPGKQNTDSETPEV